MRAFHIFCATLTACVATANAVAQSERLRFENGRWFDGEQFRTATVEIENGLLDFDPPRRRKAQVRTFDLEGRHVTPPFCEAHTHNLGVASGNEQTIAKYLSGGIFYVKVQTNVPYYTGRMRHVLGGPSGVDAMFANQGITGGGGHPILTRELLFKAGAYPGVSKEWLRDNTYFVADSDADVERFWPMYLSYRPDFTKLFLVHSDEYERRKDDPVYYGNRGLVPEMFRKLVQRAHEHGLRVSVHIDSTADFDLAVDAGADELAHLPGGRSVQRLTPDLASKAAQNGVVLVTTGILIEGIEKRDPALHAQLREAQIANLRLLKQAGVTLAIGSDMFEQNAVDEAFYLHELGVFTELELLRMWTENCARTVFPKRRIGRLADGYEASFLVLEGNPLADFANTRRIVRKVKDGVPLDAER